MRPSVCMQGEGHTFVSHACATMVSSLGVAHEVTFQIDQSVGQPAMHVRLCASCPGAVKHRTHACKAVQVTACRGHPSASIQRASMRYLGAVHNAR